MMKCIVCGSNSFDIDLKNQKATCHICKSTYDLSDLKQNASNSQSDFEVSSKGELKRYTGTSTKVRIPSYITKISGYTKSTGEYRFSCSITDPGAIRPVTIFVGAFSETNVIEVIVPSTVEEIELDAFDNCSLKKIVFEGTNCRFAGGYRALARYGCKIEGTFYDEIDIREREEEKKRSAIKPGVAVCRLNNDGKLEVISSNNGPITELIIEEGVTSILKSEVGLFTEVKKVTIPASLKYIADAEGYGPLRNHRPLTYICGPGIHNLFHGKNLSGLIGTTWYARYQYLTEYKKCPFCMCALKTTGFFNQSPEHCPKCGCTTWGYVYGDYSNK